MKKKILILAIIGISIITSLTAFAQQNKKNEKESLEVQKSLKEIKPDSVDFKTFKKMAELNIAENKNKIIKLKACKIISNKKVREKYNKDIKGLEVQNNQMKDKIERGANMKMHNWSSFVCGFNFDMDELTYAINDFRFDHANN